MQTVDDVWDEFMEWALSNDQSASEAEDQIAQEEQDLWENREQYGVEW